MGKVRERISLYRYICVWFPHITIYIYIYIYIYIHTYKYIYWHGPVHVHAQSDRDAELVAENVWSDSGSYHKVFITHFDREVLP
jgi:hypothetical protein